MKLYGVVIRNIENNHLINLWFETIQERDNHIHFFSRTKYEIEEYISDQMEFTFDTREG